MPSSSTTGVRRGRRTQPSLRRRLLVYLLIPTLLLMLVDAVFVYFVALNYSNGVHDRDLVYSTMGLADAIDDAHSNGRMDEASRALIEFDPEGRTFYSVRSRRNGLVDGSARQLSPPRTLRVSDHPVLYDAVIGTLPVRAASLVMRSPVDAGDELVVSMAESFHDRDLTAREILMITIPTEALLIVILLALVWQGVQSGLRILDVPIRRLALGDHGFDPVSGPDIPVEILPLTRAIDGLFERVQSLVAVQERFVADAAHQLRTPLAGLAMHVERACAARNEADFDVAMQHVKVLTARVTRAATQLLSLARFQAPQDDAALPERIDFAQWLPGIVAARVPESLDAAVDLGYEGGVQPAFVAGEPRALQELFDNLIDNALRHVSPGGTVTVSLQPRVVRGACVRVAVEDDGPGVPDDVIDRLGERFFRGPGAADGGSGLGLAIVRRIADVHGARVGFERSAMGGLRVVLDFPGDQARAG